MVATGATPDVPFTSHTTGNGDGSAIWQKLWGYYQFQRDAFLSHDHQRSKSGRSTR